MEWENGKRGSAVANISPITSWSCMPLRWERKERFSKNIGLLFLRKKRRRQNRDIQILPFRHWDASLAIAPQTNLGAQQWPLLPGNEISVENKQKYEQVVAFITLSQRNIKAENIATPNYRERLKKRRYKREAGKDVTKHDIRMWRMSLTCMKNQNYT